MLAKGEFPKVAPERPVVPHFPLCKFLYRGHSGTTSARLSLTVHFSVLILCAYSHGHSECFHISLFVYSICHSDVLCASSVANCCFLSRNFATPTHMSALALWHTIVLCHSECFHISLFVYTICHSKLLCASGVAN